MMHMFTINTKHKPHGVKRMVQLHRFQLTDERELKKRKYLLTKFSDRRNTVAPDGNNGTF